LELKEFIKLIEEKNFSDVQQNLIEMKEADIAELISELEDKQAALVYRLLPKTLAAEVFPFLNVETQTGISSLVSEDELKEIIATLNFDDKIDLIEEMPANVVKKILKNTPNRERTLINQFLNYPEDSAGSIMTIEFVDLKKEMTVEMAMNRIRKIGVGKETIYTCYVTDPKRKLEGTVSLKELVLSEPNKSLEEVMNPDVVSVNTHDDQEYIANKFKKYGFLSMPVVDNESRLVGIITIDDVVDVIEEETTEDFQLMAATVPSDEEYMSTTPFILARRRIIWLIILMFSAIITEYITDRYSQLTSQFVMLVGVMPMLMSTGGNAGAQSSTLVIRSLTLGDIKFKDIFKVIFKEIQVGFLIGITLGILNFIRIVTFSGDYKLALIVGSTLVGTTTMAALMGGTLPIIAKKAKLDPAIMASPLITTITDATTLMIFFAIATYILMV